LCPSEQRSEAFQRWLAIIDNKLPGCPICGRRSPSEEMLTIANIVRFGSQGKPDKEKQFLTVRCGQCGNLQYFSASYIGIQV
jgi:hypothetical protein